MNHQRLKCYMLLIEEAKRIPTLIKVWPRGSSYLVDQLKRAMSSGILNLGEGNGRFKKAERRHFFEIASASLDEVSAIMDVACAFGYSNKDDCESIKDALHIACKMIQRLP